LTDQNFKEDSPSDEYEQDPFTFTINTSSFHTKRFQSQNKKSSSFHDPHNKKLPFYIHLTTFKSDLFTNINKELQSEGKTLSLSLFPQILKDFFNKQSLFGENLKKLGIFWIENLMIKRLELKQSFEGIWYSWDNNKKNFLSKMGIGENEVVTEEFKGIIQTFETLLNQEVRTAEMIIGLSLISKEFAENIQRNSLEKSNEKNDFITILVKLLEILKTNDDIFYEKNSINNAFFIRKKAEEMLCYFAKDLEEFNENFKEITNKHKSLCYHELLNLLEILPKKLKILKSLLKSLETQCNLILLPYKKAFTANESIVIFSDKSMKTLENKILKFEARIKSIKVHSSFFNPLKHKLKTQLISSKKTLEIETFRISSQIKLIYDFPRIETDLEALKAIFSNEIQQEKNTFTKEFRVEFLTKTSKIRLFLELLKFQPKPLKIIVSFTNFLETHMLILSQNYKGINDHLKERQREELQKIDSLRKEAEFLSQTVQSYLEKNLLTSEEKNALKGNLRALISKFDTLSKWPEITDYSLGQISSLKTQLEKDSLNITYFEETLNIVGFQIAFSALKPLLNSLKLSSKINLLKPFLKKLEIYHSLLSQIPSIYRPVKEIILRIAAILPCLSHFQKVYEEFVEKFVTFSKDYEELKEEILSFREIFLSKLASLSVNKEDQTFFLSCGEEFLISLKKHYESLTPQNINYVNNESKHMLLEIKSRINFFYCSKENLHNMANSTNRQLRLKSTIVLFQRILGKLKLTYDNKTLEEKNTIFLESEEILFKCQKLVESLLKISEIAGNIIEKGIDQKKKNLVVKERFKCLKEFLKDLKEGKKTLVLESKSITDGQIESIYISLLDDMAKLEEFLEKLVPDIERFFYFKEFFEKNKAIFVRDQNFLWILKGFLKFQKDVNNN